MIGLLSILFLEFIVYFGSNLFLSKFAQRKINEATENIYQIDFNRFSFSLLRRGFFMDGFVMRPINPEIRKEDQALFDIKLDQISFTGLWYSFSQKNFTIGRIYIDNPNIILDLPENSEFPGQRNAGNPGEVSGKISPIRALEAEIKKTVQSINLTGLMIEEVEIDHANFFFFNFLSQDALRAENTSLMVRNIDFTTQKEWETPFNAEGFEFELDQVTFPLPDGVHIINANRVLISSLDKFIDIQKFILTPDKSKDSKAYYQVAMEELRVGNVDLNKAFMTSVLDIDELILDDPDFNVASNSKAQSDSAASGDLNDFIKGSLESVSIKELSINRGKFVKSEVDDTLKNRIELDELDFKMIQFYLGEDAEKRENQFFYGKDAAMDIKGSRVYLGDDLHIIVGEEVSVSSFKDELIVRNLSIQPRTDLLANPNPEKLLRVDLTEFSIEEVDLKKLQNEGILVADQILIYQPKVEFTELLESTTPGKQVQVEEIIAEFLGEVRIGNFEVQEGLIQFKDERGERSNDIGFEKFSFRLEEMELFAAPQLPLVEKLSIGEIYLSLDQYRLKLRDNLHTILADKLIVDSRRQLLEVTNFSIRPENQAQIQASLDTYGKTAAIDFSVPIFRAEGIDIKSAFYDERLFVRQIFLPGPVFTISNYREKARSKDTPESTDEVKNLLLGYFKSIQIDSLSLDKAQIKYQSLIENKRSVFEEDNFSLNLKNFILDQDAIIQESKTMFSDEIDLVFNNYSFSLAGGKYEVSTDKLQYNSRTKSIVIKDLELAPNSEFSDRIQLGMQFPSVSFQGVDIEEFFFDNKLDLDKLEIDQGNIEIGIDRKVAVKSPGNLPKNAKKRTLDEIVIDTIQSKNSTVSINYQVDESILNSIQTEFELMIREFRLDSAITASRNVGDLYQEVNLSLNDFKFAFPDSVHTLGFSEVNISTLQEVITFSDFYLTPKDQFGTPGNPVIDAKIDQLILRNNQLSEIQESGVFDLKEVRLVNPKVDVYLDTVKIKREFKPVKVKSSSALVQSILLGDFHLENGDLTFHRKGIGPIPRLDFQEISLDVEGLNLDLLDQNQALDLKKFAAVDSRFHLGKYSILTPDSLYQVDIGSVDFMDRNLVLKDIYYRPVDGIYGLLRKLPYQTEAVTARIDAVRLMELDPLSYLESNSIKAMDLTVEGPEIDLFRDKRHPFDSAAIRPMPQHLLENAGINADLISLRVRDGRVRYFEFAEKGMMPGMVSFHRLNMDMAPFYLRTKSQEYPLDQLRIGLEAYIMDTSKVNLDAVMYFEEKYPMDVSVRMEGFYFGEVNDFLAKTLFVKAVDGTVTDGNWQFTLTDDEAIGEMKFAYSDLKIQFLDSLTLEQGQGKLRIYTVGANLLAKNNNPRALSNRVVSRKIYQERDKRKFVFSAWWKATFSGLRSTLGFGRAKMPKGREEED
ncbi:hypothetical protein [Algoriphagus boritolerans]|uniref:Uncharacterized protein n=1 Tax=Algoriphagus boritolerans DSM 17298 = JCM 18970 TaxID=1120964 RepID=A0A1H5SQW1_9BACT|nr:hypothetical protein [Algoriphagus boritolerans]SEF52810.1 hypothetical protein SAMN03080598_00460 [Algoriphagus boritolerans DSM 17298 = JCM 18970]